MAKNDLISRSGLGVDFCDPDAFKNKAYAEGWNSLIKIIKEAHAVDAVEVVRCKDCEEYIPWLDGEKICGRVGSYYGNTKPDDFCSRGNRRTNGR